MGFDAFEGGREKQLEQPNGIWLYNNNYYYYFKLINLFYLSLASLGLSCCARAFSSCSEQGLLFIAVRRLLIVVASHCGARALGAWASVGVPRGLSSCGSRALERRLSSCGAQA